MKKPRNEKKIYKRKRFFFCSQHESAGKKNKKKMTGIILAKGQNIGGFELVNALGSGSFGQVWNTRTAKSVPAVMKITPFFLYPNGKTEIRSNIHDFCREVYIYRIIANAKQDNGDTFCDIVSRCGDTSFVTTITGTNDKNEDVTLRAGIIVFSTPAYETRSLHDFYYKVLWDALLEDTAKTISSVNDNANNPPEEASGATKTRSALYWKVLEDVVLSLMQDVRDIHTRGIYHHDLKLENVIVDKILVPRKDRAYYNSLLIDFNASQITAHNIELFVAEKDPDHVVNLKGIQEALGQEEFDQIVASNTLPEFITRGNFITTPLYFPARFASKITDAWDLVRPGRWMTLRDYLDSMHTAIFEKVIYDADNAVEIDIHAVGIIIYFLVISPKALQGVYDLITTRAQLKVKQFYDEEDDLTPEERTKYIKDQMNIEAFLWQPTPGQVTEAGGFLGDLINGMIGNKSYVSNSMDAYIEQAKRAFAVNALTQQSGGVHGAPPVISCDMCSRPAQFQCAGCQEPSYCSPACQKKDWVEGQHRVDCAPK